MTQMTTYERDAGCYCHALYCNSFCDTCLTFFSTRPQEKAEEQRRRANWDNHPQMSPSHDTFDPFNTSDMQSGDFSVHV